MPTDKGLVVAVTGAAGYVAGRLIEGLARDDRVERILGFDVRAPRVDSSKFLFDEIDVRNPAIEARLAGVDVLVHLAFVMDPIRDEGEMRDVNVNGSQNAFKCAARAGVRKIVYTSSAVVYGAHPDNDVPLTEDSPLRANLDFSYPAHKLEVEYVVKEVAAEHRDLGWVVFRPAIVFGPNVDSAWAHMLEMPVLLGIQGYSPPLQFVHEDDVGRALQWAVTEEVSGYYNLAAPGWLDGDEVLAIVGRKRRDLPEPVAFAFVDRLWSLGLSEAPSGLLHYVMHPWVVSTDKLTAAGFTTRRSNLETLGKVADRARGHVRLGSRRLRRLDLARAGLAGLGVIGAVAGARAIRARR
ncbi:MAG TPA: NAD-dependent epimerase/dehydratase family protein [Actinomycetota bacterium]|jgi:nucleoside-diphosphate-sugar epimerase